MKRKILMPLVFLALAARSAALTEDSKKVADELVTTLQEEMKAMLADGDDNREAASVRQIIRQIQAALAQDNNRTIDQVLDNLGNFEPTKKVQEGIAALKKAIKDEQQDKTKELIAELEGILDTSREKIVRAEEPAELDKVLASLSRNRFNNMGENQGYDTNDATVRTLLSEISNARQFVTGWQDYLQANISGNTSQAAQSLRNLTSQDTTLIPRSQIIARLDFTTNSGGDVSSITGGLKTLEDMKPAIQKLSRMQTAGRSSGSSESTEIREILQTLVRMEKCHREFRAGLPVTIEMLYQPLTSSDPTGKLDFIELRAALLLMVLPRCLGLPETFQPTAGETVDRFLERAMEDATTREDIAACRRIRDVRQTIAQSSTFNSRDVDSLRDYEAGKKQLAAGQYLLAVVSLQNALKSGNELIPATKAGEMLELVRKEHPKEFEQGMMEFLTPRPLPEFDYARMPYRNYTPYSSRSMDGDPRAQGGTTLVLPVPARDTSPEVSNAKTRSADEPPPAQPKPAESGVQKADHPE